jgi:hypothetical protein
VLRRSRARPAQYQSYSRRSPIQSGLAWPRRFASQVEISPDLPCLTPRWAPSGSNFQKNFRRGSRVSRCCSIQKQRRAADHFSSDR